jgi:hypothetical protein
VSKRNYSAAGGAGGGGAGVKRVLFAEQRPVGPIVASEVLAPFMGDDFVRSLNPQWHAIHTQIQSVLTGGSAADAAALRRQSFEFIKQNLYPELAQGRISSFNLHALVVMSQGLGSGDAKLVSAKLIEALSKNYDKLASDECVSVDIWRPIAALSQHFSIEGGELRGLIHCLLKVSIPDHKRVGGQFLAHLVKRLPLARQQETVNKLIANLQSEKYQLATLSATVLVRLLGILTDGDTKRLADRLITRIRGVELNEGALRVLFYRQLVLLTLSLPTEHSLREECQDVLLRTVEPVPAAAAMQRSDRERILMVSALAEHLDGFDLASVDALLFRVCELLPLSDFVVQALQRLAPFYEQLTDAQRESYNTALFARMERLNLGWEFPSIRDLLDSLINKLPAELKQQVVDKLLTTAMTSYEHMPRGFYGFLGRYSETSAAITAHARTSLQAIIPTVDYLPVRMSYYRAAIVLGAVNPAISAQMLADIRACYADDSQIDGEMEISLFELVQASLPDAGRHAVTAELVAILAGSSVWSPSGTTVAQLIACLNPQGGVTIEVDVLTACLQAPEIVAELDSYAYSDQLQEREHAIAALSSLLPLLSDASQGQVLDCLIACLSDEDEVIPRAVYSGLNELGEDQLRALPLSGARLTILAACMDGEEDNGCLDTIKQLRPKLVTAPAASDAVAPAAASDGMAQLSRLLAAAARRFAPQSQQFTYFDGVLMRLRAQAAASASAGGATAAGGVGGPLRTPPQSPRGGGGAGGAPRPADR